MRYLFTLFALLSLLAGCRSSESAKGVTGEVHLICIEFATDDDQSVFNSIGVIRAGATVSAKSSQECKGRMLDQVTTQ